MVKIEVLNNRLTGEIQAQIRSSAEKTSRETAEEIVVGVKRLMHIPGRGRIYGDHQASAPGQAPAADTGDLWASVGSRQITPLIWVAESDDPNAANLEYGTHTILPRPAWGPAAEKARPTMAKKFVNWIKRLLR